MTTEGLVSTKTSRSDARSIEVSIAAEGLGRLESVREKANHAWNEAVPGVTRTEAQLPNSLSVRIYDNLLPQPTTWTAMLCRRRTRPERRLAESRRRLAGGPPCQATCIAMVSRALISQ
jgi:hypothetical protein